MKKLLGFLIALVLFSLLAWAQQPTGSSIAFGTAGSTCQAPSTGNTIICGTSTGAQISINGAAYVPITNGVLSFGGRTGAVVPAANDYSYAQLSGKPTTISCTTATFQSGGPAALTASGCTIQ